MDVSLRLASHAENSGQNNLPTQDNDVSEGPLDMSIKKKPRLSSPPPYRPPGQVSPTQSSQDRTCPPPPSYESSRSSSSFAVTSTRPDIGCPPRWRSRGEEDTRPIREITIITAESTAEPLVDEHFQRSLGNRYCKIFDNHPSTSVSSSSVKSFSPVTTTSSKSRSPSPSVSPDSSLSTKYEDPVKAFREEMEMNTVEDHFAKSLGDTWLKLQAQAKTDIKLSGSGKPATVTL